MKIFFSHGKESGPWGTKIQRLAAVAEALGFEYESIDYQGMSNPDERVEKLDQLLSDYEGPVVLCGSSMGGYVSTVNALNHKIEGLFLLAPALYMPNYQQQNYPVDCSLVEIVHAWDDAIIPYEHSIRFAAPIQASLQLLNSDHRLTSVIQDIEVIFRHFLLKLKLTKP